MNYVDEFVPLELIVVFDYENVPDFYVNLLKEYVQEKNIDGVILQIIHWEWQHNGMYDLLIDIVFNPGESEHGIICHDNEIIYQNTKRKLTIIDHFLENRLSSFEHVRTLECHEHEHCADVYNEVKEMESELMEEDVSEEDYMALEKPYTREYNDEIMTITSISSDTSSNDDASSISE